MLQEVTLNEEKEVRIEVTVTNTTEVIGTFQLHVFDFGSLDESGGVAFLGASNELETKYSLASWMRPEKDSVTLLPGKSETIPILIENRESLAPGGHYGAIVFESTDPAMPESPNTIAVNQMIASLVFVKKTGGAKPALELMNVEHHASLLTFSKEVIPRFHNPGNIHVVPRGRVEVLDPLGRLVYRGVLNEASSLVLPESFRLFPTTLLPVSQAFLPGKYTLRLQYRYEEETAFQMWEKQFILFPPLTSLLLLGIGGVISVYAWWKRRKKQLLNKNT